MPATLPAAPTTNAAAVGPERRVGAPDRAARRAQALFLDIMGRHVTDGAVAFLVEGETVLVGAGADEGKLEAGTPVIRVHRPRVFARVLAEGNLGLGESFMDGDWEMERGGVHDFLAVLLRNQLDRKVRGDLGTAWEVLKLQAANLLRGRQWSHVQSHYDTGDDLFECFLDEYAMTYSCGYALSPDDTPEALQFNKLDRICRKLALRPGDRLLDIGCGFGGLLQHAAAHFGVAGVGITTSRRHQELGNRRLAAAGLADRARLELRDHRTIEGRFDKVVSVGMMEHLPRKEYDRYFARIAAVLPPDGVGLVHCVGCNAARNDHDPFIQKYVFPGSGQPRLSEMAAGCERNGLAIRDVENMIRHYAPTARGWLARFTANQHRLDPARYDGRFRRMWTYYLSCCIAAAEFSDAALYQVLFQKSYSAPMPLHRV